MVSAVPSMASGGAMTLTRLPSGGARIADRRALVHAPADLANDALADRQELGIVAEADLALQRLAADFDETWPAR